MNTYLIVFLILIIAYVIYLYTRPQLPEAIYAHWSHYFVNHQFSSADLYRTIEGYLMERQVPDIYFEQIYFRERLFFSDYREYERIQYGTYTFDICAAPFGTGYFVSWWFGERVGWFRKILFALPFIGIYFRLQYQHKTYYIIDKEETFQRAVHQAVMDAIDQMVSDKGLRALTELERQPKSLRTKGI